MDGVPNGGIYNLVKINLYAYVANNLINLIDPYGKSRAYSERNSTPESRQREAGTHKGAASVAIGTVGTFTGSPEAAGLF